ncbi:aminoacyl-tRNA deacylase [Corynebacterium lizhenjunii]|uniref:Cys-tRNA(Pro)/Cys-tRNA(Cys) deacylase n=1 Tax=Corynebacterium lizhenjunii TaxID=2709394 RepID=A0A7T0KGT4_9CORY|nr:aminoacyl-tRNA deacylase [Corynebacterium lizhenjunii]QPK79699.1 aminoacyl-tRNA deacylase [Corynebacterium lizhenjunii]
MAKKSPRAATPALKILEQAGIAHTVHTFASGQDNFGQHAVAALGVEPERVFKTLVIDLTAGKGPRRALAVCVVPMTHQLSLKKAAAAHGVAKVCMAESADAAKSSGYVPGGISPLGHKQPLPTVWDESALLCDSVFFSGGKRGLDIEMDPQLLPQVLEVTFADVVAD